MDQRRHEGGALEATDRRLLDLLRDGASGTEAAQQLGLDAREVAARLLTLRERFGVGSTRRLLERTDGDQSGTR